MVRQFYAWAASGLTTGLLLALMMATPLAAQEQPGAGSSTDNSMATDYTSTDTGTDSTMTPETDTSESAGADVARPGTNRETAGPPFAEPITLAPGATDWYRFRYVFDEEVDSEPGNAVVTLKMSEPGCVTFEVTTSGRLNFPYDDNGDWVGPIGRGTPFDDGDKTFPSTLLWVGSGRFSESHFVIVKGRGANPCTYQLTISGSPVVY